VEALLEHQATLREWAFYGALVAMLCWESLAPRRQRLRAPGLRWASNGAVLVLNWLILRWLFPLLGIGVAVLAQQRGWGLFNQLTLPGVVAVLASVLLLDLWGYARHRLFHATSACWRFHRMHHSDQDVDWSTGVRFHPFEAIVSIGLRLLVVVAIGAPPLAVLLTEMLIAATAFFQHGNVALATAADRWLRHLLVTPDMHRVHHSVVKDETDSNFGVIFPWWDRLFGTYRQDPAHGHGNMRVGLDEFADPRHIRLHWMLAMPFLSAREDSGKEVKENVPI